MRPTSTTSIYDHVTARIVCALDDGVIPWRKDHRAIFPAARHATKGADLLLRLAERTEQESEPARVGR